MLLWAVLFAVFLIGEVVIPALVSIWLALAALIMVFLALFVEDLQMQIFIFLILSFAFLLGIRKYVTKFVKTNDNLRGEVVDVLKLLGSEFHSYKYEVKYKDGVWTALSKEELKEGDKAYIKSFDGNRIIISKEA